MEHELDASACDESCHPTLSATIRQESTPRDRCGEVRSRAWLQPAYCKLPAAAAARTASRSFADPARPGPVVVPCTIVQ
uniref:Uncharacterized protein n=1 Tax=Arundo donax TaxID=35708 RepID=A0A0A9ECP8_ARUDO